MQLDRDAASERPRGSWTDRSDSGTSPSFKRDDDRPRRNFVSLPMY